MKHSWGRMGTAIYQCPKCGLYMCHSLRDITRDNSKRVINVEYSTMSGEVKDGWLNPAVQPPCGGVVYA